MGLFNIFKRKNKYQIYYESISDILNLLKRKRDFIKNLDTKYIVDLEFDKIMFERMRLLEIIKSGSISFLGKDFIDNMLLIFDDQKITKDDIEYIWEYLLNEQNKLKKLF
jgi:hypothetical protein